jgi:hypothetical protein
MQLRCEALLLAFFDQRDLIRQGPQAFVGLLKESIRVLQLGGIGDLNAISAPAPEYPDACAAVRRGRVGPQIGPLEENFPP